MSTRLTSLVLVVAALATVVAVGCGSSGAASSVATFPMAGTLTASPKTTISFRGASSIGGISVTGSRSGKHSGTTKAHSDGNGVSFIPSKPFERGETVTVKADQSLLGARSKAVTFRIAEKAPVGVPGNVQHDPGGDPPEAHHYVSRPDLRPPTLKIHKHTSSAAPGDLFLSPKAGPGQDGPLLADGDGEPIFYKPVPKDRSAYDFRVQNYDGKPALTWWQGEVHHGQGRGKGVILDSTYKQVKSLPPGNGYRADFHEFQLSRDGKTAFFLIYEPVKFDLTSIGGSRNGSVIDGIVQEVDIKTGLVLFEWHALGQLRLSESYNHIPKSKPLFDHTHLNSIFEEKDGNLLISSRDTHSALELSRKTGKLLWRLGGKKSDYAMRSGAQFVGQHHISRMSDGRLTVFDNGAPPSPGRPARGLVLSVSEAKKVVKLSKSFQRPEKPHSPSQGSVQALPNGNFLVSWGGDSPFFDEYTPSGKVALDGELSPDKDDTYRVWKFPWTGQPSRPPDVVARNSAGVTTVYVSWNGATEVKEWDVLAGATADSLSSVKKAAKTGFETKIPLPSQYQAVQVRALGNDGQELGKSKVVTPTTG